MLRELAAAVAQAGPDTIDDPSLDHGLAGRAVFLTVYGADFDDAEATAQARRYLDRAATICAAGYRPHFFGGLVGLQWALQLCAPQLYGEAPGRATEVTDIDRMLLRAVTASPWRGHYELVRGLVGYGVYALCVPMQAVADEIIAAIVARLAEMVRPLGGRGSAWFTLAELLTANWLPHFPDGRFDFGLAHGTPGVVAWLSHVVHAGGPSATAAAELLGPAVDALLCAELPGEAVTRYPMFAGLDGEPAGGPTPRLGWCYGDLSVAFALHLAAASTGEAGWAAVAERVGHAAARRQPSGSRVGDPWLCHGTAGIAHCFARLHQRTSIEAYGAASAHWWKETLRHHRTRQAWMSGPGPGLLSGPAGVGLALMAATSEVEPRWDSMLLLSGGGQNPPAPIGGAGA